MRALIALFVVVYLIGVGVALAPTIQTNIRTATAPELASSIVQSLPDALAWPTRAFRTLSGKG
jgi:hypothetical protein